MFIGEQSECQTYRVVVVDRGRAEILLVPNRDRLLVPSVTIPRWQRVAENLVSAMRSEWGQEVVCLFTLDDTRAAEAPGEQVHYQVAEHYRPAGEPRVPMQWVETSCALQESLADRSDFEAIQRVLALCRGESTDAEVGPFVRPGWFEELCRWVEAVTEPKGCHLNGAFRQLNASSTFSLIRFETDGPAFWFKAVGEPNQREFHIIRTLAKLFPKYIPLILADRPDWKGWLTQEVEGRHLSDDQEGALWEAAAEALAKLQLASCSHSDRILAAGAHDLRVAPLSDLVQPFMKTIAALMARQTKVPPAVLTCADLDFLGEQIQEALNVLEGSGIPDTLGHLDLNPGNIIISSDHCAFLDWTEAYVGHPFLSLQYLLEHLRRGRRTDEAIEARLVASYGAHWQHTVSSAAVVEALALSPLLAVFSYAAGTSVWRDAQSLQEPATAGYLRSLTRRMHREANQLADRRLLCLR